MKITKVKIENFKSIENIEIDFKKHGGSYTTMFVGLNECGKSNILEAMSFLSCPNGEFNYSNYSNQKLQNDSNIEYVDIDFCLEFEEKKIYINAVKEKISKESRELLDFEIKNISKNIFLKKTLETKTSTFNEDYRFDIVLTKKLYIKSLDLNLFQLSKSQDLENSFEELTKEKFKEYFNEDIDKLISKYEPQVSTWKSSEEYFLNNINLYEFSNDPDQNIPLKGIFNLNNLKTNNDIQNKINEIGSSQNRRRTLQKQLSKKATNYINNIWQHPIKIDIEITDNLDCFITIVDKGEPNEDYFYNMNERSEGAKHFLSLLFSLSIQHKIGNIKNRLVLIDEPEKHLHPSAIRDLSKELIKLGENNYVFVATHSPFLIDKTNKSRNIIIKKNKDAITEEKRIKEDQNIIDDEVLREAFGIDVYKDLLSPHSILLEGASDKRILDKVFKLLGKNDLKTTNGHGSNIHTLASKLNYDDISLLIIVDDDQDGKNYKKKILEIEGNYSEKNVFTLRDLVGDIPNRSTIEDLLGRDFIQSKFKENYKKFYEEDLKEFELDENKTFLPQIKDCLQEKKKQDIEKFIDKLKSDISHQFALQQSSFEKNFPLLKKLSDQILKKLDN